VWYPFGTLHDVSVSVDGLRNLTFDEFVELPEELHTGAELFDGVVHVSSPVPKHQDAAFNVAAALRAWCRAKPGRGKMIIEYLIRINDRSGYKPDVACYSADRVPDRDAPAALAPPSIVIEVLSPSTRQSDLMRKPGGYASIGVDEMWLVDVDNGSVVLLRGPVGGGYVEAVELAADGAITSPLLPGFSLPVADVFAE